MVLALLDLLTRRALALCVAVCLPLQRLTTLLQALTTRGHLSSLPRALRHPLNCPRTNSNPQLVSRTLIMVRLLLHLGLRRLPRPGSVDHRAKGLTHTTPAVVHHRQKCDPSWKTERDLREMGIRDLTRHIILIRRLAVALLAGRLPQLLRSSLLKRPPVSAMNALQLRLPNACVSGTMAIT